MKYCNYCGAPITEPARFCPKCGAQLYAETVYMPIKTINPQPLVAAGPSAGAQQANQQADPKSGPSKVLIGVLCGAAVLVMLIVASILGSPKGITGTWKMTMDMEDFADYMDMDASLYQMVGMDKFDVQLNLADDNTLTLGLYAGGDSVSVDSVTVGTYEVLSDDTIHMALGERTSKYSIFGEEETETDDFDEEDDFSYSLDGNKLTLIVEDMPLQFKRS